MVIELLSAVILISQFFNINVKKKIPDHTCKFLLDERQHSKVDLTVSHYNLPLEPIHYCQPWCLGVHLETEEQK